MLTESESAWLKRRSKSKYCQGKYCPWCPIPLLDCADMCVEGRCPTRGGDMGDAAEFNARVAAKLAMMMYQLAANIMTRDFSCEKSCIAHLVCQKDKSCIHSFMKYARIAVEEEMGDDMDI